MAVPGGIRQSSMRVAGIHSCVFVHSFSVPRTSVSVQLHLYFLIRYKNDTFSLMMHIPFQLRSFTSSCPLRGLLPLQSFLAFIQFSDRIGHGCCAFAELHIPPSDDECTK